MMCQLAICLAASALSVANVQPIADVFVDQSAANCVTGTGTAASPVCSISAAIAIAAPGDTIRIAPGTYVENVNIGFDLGLVGTAGPDVTIVNGAQAGSVITIPSAVLVSIDGLRLTNGRATNGGGINVAGTLSLTNSTIDNNSGNNNGGGISVGFGATVSIVACTIHDNGAGINGFGGGIVMSGADLEICDSTIAHNAVSATFDTCYATGGGGIAAGGGTLTISGSTIAYNDSECEGGGLWTSTDLVMSNSTVSGNRASWGGAMYAARFQLENVTVTRNLAYDYYGYGGLFGGIWGFGSGARTLHNCIVAENITGYIHAEDLAGTFTSLGHNFIGSGGTGFYDGLLGDLVGSQPSPVYPGLTRLRDNGGPTETHLPLFGSLVLDMGDALSFEALDQRGIARPIGGLPDIGACELALAEFNLCAGDGGDQMGCTECPCSNNSPLGLLSGCLNSSGVGAQIQVTGSVSVSLPAMSANDLRFALSGATPSSVAILMSGHGVGPFSLSNPCGGKQTGLQSVEYDGLRCAVWLLRRHGTRTIDGNGGVGLTNSPWGGEGKPQLGLAQAQGGFVTGQTRYFQAIYRDSPLSMCMRGLNTSQAIGVAFSP